MKQNKFVAIIVLLIAVVFIGAFVAAQYYHPFQTTKQTTVIPSSTSTSVALPAASSTPEPTSSSLAATETQFIAATNGGIITLANGNSVEIPDGAFNQDETVTASFSNEALPQAPSHYFVSIGNSVSLSLSDTLAPLPVPFPPRQIAESQGKFVTSTMMKFAFNAGIDETEFIQKAIPTIDVIGTDNASIFLAVFTTSTFDTATNQAIIYVDPAVFQLPSPTSTVRVKRIIVGMVGL